jgi:ribosomal RNA-processing protein 12
VAKSKAEVLHEHLKGVVEGLMSWQSDTKNSFKAKVYIATRILRKEICIFFFLELCIDPTSHCQVKSLIEILVKKCGLDAVKAVMPEEHMKLLTNIRKVTTIVLCCILLKLVSRIISFYMLYLNIEYMLYSD